MEKGQRLTDSDGNHKHRPTPAAGLGNWRASPLPFSGKLKLAISNNLIKLRKRQSCCGHHGEPGC